MNLTTKLLCRKMALGMLMFTRLWSADAALHWGLADAGVEFTLSSHPKVFQMPYDLVWDPVLSKAAAPHAPLSKIRIGFGEPVASEVCIIGRLQ